MTLLIFIVKFSSQSEKDIALPLLDKSFFDVFGVEDVDEVDKSAPKIKAIPSHSFNPWLRGLRKTLKQYGK